MGITRQHNFGQRNKAYKQVVACQLNQARIAIMR